MIGFRLLTVNRPQASASPQVLRAALANTGDPNNAFYKYDASANQFKRDSNLVGSAAGSDVAVSPDSSYMCLAVGTTPFISLYKRNGDAWSALPAPATLPAGAVTCCAFSRNGNYLAVGHYTAPFITVYKRSGDSFVKIPDLATALNQRVTNCHFSPVSDHLAMVGLFSPYGGVVGVSDSGLSPMQSPSPIPWYYSYGVRFSPKGDLIIIGSQTNPYYFAYKFDPATGAFGARLTTGDVGVANPRAIVIGPNSDFFYMCGTTDPYFTGFKLTASAVGAKLPVPTFLTSYGIDMDITADGKYIGVAHYGSPFLTFLEKNGDTLTPLPAVDTPGSNNAAGIQFYRT